MTIIAMIIPINIVRKIVISTSKTIIIAINIEMINTIMEIKILNEKIYIKTKATIKMKAGLIKTKREIIHSLLNIVSKNHIAITNIDEIIKNIKNKIAIKNIELGKYIILN